MLGNVGMVADVHGVVCRNVTIDWIVRYPLAVSTQRACCMYCYFWLLVNHCMFCCSIYISSVSVLRIGVSCYDTFAHTSLQESRVRGSSAQTADGDIIVRAPGLHLAPYSYSGCEPKGSPTRPGGCLTRIAGCLAMSAGHSARRSSITMVQKAEE